MGNEAERVCRCFCPQGASYRRQANAVGRYWCYWKWRRRKGTFVTNNAVSKLEMSGISLKCLRACNGENSLTLPSQAIFLGRLARCVLSSCLPFLERRTAVAQRDVLTTEVGKPNRGC